jgi:hypothetical protein
MRPSRLAIFFSLMLLLLLAGCVNQGATITWSTASEVDTAGYNLYRSDSPDGPWQKVNDELIPPSEDPVSGGAYSYVDKTAKPGQTYYYQLEEVELSGASTRFDPIKMQSKNGIPAWYWWVGGAILAIAIGWFLGGLFAKKGKHESGT